MKRNMIFRRIRSALITLLLSSAAIFALMRFAPGDPIDFALGLGPGDMGVNMDMLNERKAELRKQYDLDENIFIQYVRWLKRVVRFDLGNSMRTKIPITEELGRRIPATLLLSFTALVIESVIGLLAGFYSALKAGKFQDGFIRILCVLLGSLPAFVISLAALFLFSVKLHWYDISSRAELHRLWLPAIVLGIIGSPQIIRMVRSEMLSELGKPYVSAIQSCGLPKRMVVYGAFRNALLPIITTLAMSFAHLIGGSVVIESIFNWPGLGNYAMSSILIHDYPAIQGYTLLTVASIIVINLIVETAYLLADPHVRRSESRSLKAAREVRTHEKKKVFN